MQQSKDRNGIIRPVNEFKTRVIKATTKAIPIIPVKANPNARIAAKAISPEVLNPIITPVAPEMIIQIIPKLRAAATSFHNIVIMQIITMVVITTPLSAGRSPDLLVKSPVKK